MNSNASNYNNDQNKSNLLFMNNQLTTVDSSGNDTTLSTRPYFFSFTIASSSQSGGTIRSNMQTLEILFEATQNQYIYPFINVADGGSANPSTTLNSTSSKWMFTKIS